MKEWIRQSPLTLIFDNRTLPARPSPSVPPNRLRARLSATAVVVFKPAHLRRTGMTALLVGSWLTVFNLGDVLIQGPLTLHLILKIALNFATPFVVANIGLLSRASK